MSETINMHDNAAWDDDALVDSWNEAFEEYKHYHSLHIRGIKVENVLRAVDNGKEANLTKADYASPEDLDETMRTAVNGSEDGEIDEDEDYEQGEEDAEDDEGAEAQMHELKSDPASAPTTAPAPAPSTTLPPPVPMPAHPALPVLPEGQSEGLKNLLMSWYYAGYYTGLYEGEQKAVQGGDQTQGEGIGEEQEGLVVGE